MRFLTILAAVLADLLLIVFLVNAPFAQGPMKNARSGIFVECQSGIPANVALDGFERGLLLARTRVWHYDVKDMGKDGL